MAVPSAIAPAADFSMSPSLCCPQPPLESQRNVPCQSPPGNPSSASIKNNKNTLSLPEQLFIPYVSSLSYASGRIQLLQQVDMYSRNGQHDSDEEEEYGYRERGLDMNEGDDVEEHGFEPRQQIDDDVFIFKHTELPGLPKTERIRKLVVSEETKILVTESNKLFRWRTKVDAEFKAYELPETSKQNFLGLISTKERSANVRNIYLDPRGWHCIIAGEGGINYYLNYRDSKVKILKELKGVNIKAVGFHGAISETKSGDILMAVEGGILLLYRIDLEQNGEVREQNVLQYQLYLSSEVTALEILRLTQANNRSYVVVILFTNSSLVSFTGPDDLEPLIQSYRNQTERLKEVQMPRSYQSMSQVCYSKLLKRPTSILWVNNNSIVRIRVPDPEEAVSDSFLARNEALRWAKRADLPQAKAYQVQETPISIGVTDFHYYLLFQDSISIISSITQRLVVHEEFKGSLVSDMAYERSTGIFWIFSNKGVIKLDTTREGNEAWKLLLEEKKYKEAYAVCKAKNQNVSYVAGIYADHLFANRQYDRAAVYFSETSRTFEEIFLKFLQVNSDEARDGLELYLKAWLGRLRPQERSQRCLLVSWLIELMIYRLNRLERAERENQGGAAEGARRVQRLKEKQRELEELLEKNLNVVNEELVYLVMQSHGRIQNLINFADKKNNFEMIVMHYLSEEAYEKALEYLKNVKDPKVVEVVYKYAHIFFRYQTEKTVQLLTKSVRDFKPIKLMPGLMNIPDNRRVHGIELLRYCVEELKSRDRSLHNILIFFYATSPKEKHAELIELMDKSRLEFDLDFGLRLFRNYKMAEAQIIVYGKMYLYGEAVALALEHNKEDLAKKYADKPEYQDERKKLWIEIAKHYLIKKGRISEVIELTKKSKVVKIEDLLPHFNQNIKIENFKDEICESLKSYSAEIGRLKSLMDSYSANAQQLKNQLRMVKNRCIEIDSSHKCEECFKTLFSQEFYIFPCMHGFHRACLQLATSAHSSSGSSKLQEVEALSQDIRSLEDRLLRKKQDQRTVKDTSSGFSLMNALNIWNNKRDQEGGSMSMEKEEAELREKKKEIDSILAAECLYCGPGIVDTITMPFNNEYLRDSWKI